MTYKEIAKAIKERKDFNTPVIRAKTDGIGYFIRHINSNIIITCFGNKAIDVKSIESINSKSLFKIADILCKELFGMTLKQTKKKWQELKKLAVVR